MRSLFYIFLAVLCVPSALAEGLKIDTSTHEYTLAAHGIIISPKTISVLNVDGSVTFDDLTVQIRIDRYGAGQGWDFYVGSLESQSHAIHKGICKLIKMEHHKPEGMSGFEYVTVIDGEENYGSGRDYANFSVDGSFLGILPHKKGASLSVLKSVTCK